MRGYYEFFAGGGMVTAGLGPGWNCLFANDFDEKKSAVYRRNWGGARLVTGDVRALAARDLPGRADLAWASFPCQDLSLAGEGAGLAGARSGAFWPFWSLMEALAAEGRAPAIIALENVCGALTAHGGRDFSAICAAFARTGHRFGALVIDAALFVPQSRPRLFFVGVREDVALPASHARDTPSPVWHPRAMLTARDRASPEALRGWVWWSLPAPPARNAGFAQLVEDEPADVRWHSPAETGALLGKMSPLNLAKVEAARGAGRRLVGCVYKRTRVGERGEKIQRAEVRFDDVAGCLRTPAGGSSRQLILVVEGAKVRSRLISGRETARLMGLADSYALPERYNDTYHLTGDGVAPPVVRHLAAHLFEPILAASVRARVAA